MAGGRTLLISDVDNTLLGDDRALARFRAWYERRRSRVRLVYSSGRFYESVAESVRTTELPAPFAIVGGVGTQFRIYPSGRPVFAWQERICERWDADRVRDVLAEFGRLTPQAAEHQSERKVSYFLHAAAPEELKMIRRALRAESIAADLIYSSRRDLDVVPAGLNKGSAARFAADFLGYRGKEVVVCGDSANDLAMFENGFPGVVVGNAHPELLALDSRLVYQSPYDYAAGVLDGIKHWLNRRKQRSARRRYATSRAT
jgi:sucrose-6F-phosphate phosphohydrolase